MKKSSITFVFILVLFLYTGSAHARSSILNNFNSAYPNSTSGDNAGCQLCHGQSTSTWNEYGWDLRQNGANFGVLENLPSINANDGTTYLDEIDAGTQPGWTTGANNNLYNSSGLISDTATPPGGIGALDPPTANQQPVADANGPYTGTAGIPVTFDGSGSSDSDGTITSYSWNFGDGSTGTGVSPNHTYAAAGSYTVSLTVTDDGGATNTDMTTAAIEDDPNYDGNNDGIADSLQDNVASFRTSGGLNYVTLESQPGTSISNYKAVDNPSTADAPSTMEFPYGFFEFTITGVGNGIATTVILPFSAGTTFDTYYKYGPTPDDITNHWYEFLYDGQTGAEISENVITLHFVDGMRGDDDLTANGIVVDVGAPAVADNSSVSGTTVASDGNGGGCFIATAAYGSLLEPHVKILRDFRDRFLLGNTLGKIFVHLYYTYSPPVANFIAKHDSLRAMVRLSLLPVVGVSWVALKIGPVSTAALMLILISCFVGLIQFRRRYKE
jgi:PKD repeat protein